MIDEQVLKQLTDGLMYVITNVLVWKYIALCIAVNFFIDKATTPMIHKKAFPENEKPQKMWAYCLIKTPRAIKAMVMNMVILVVYAIINCHIDYGAENEFNCIVYLFISMIAVPAIYQYTLKRIIQVLSKK